MKIKDSIINLINKLFKANKSNKPEIIKRKKIINKFGYPVYTEDQAPK
jgi:hypothetical protein